MKDDIYVEDFINEDEEVILSYLKGERSTTEQIEKELIGEE